MRKTGPTRTYEIGGIHKGQPLESWKQDAKHDPALAKRIDWLFHRPGEELYDLQTDPLETNNLAANPEFAGIKARLSQQMDAWMAQQGDQGIATEMIAKTRQGAGREEKNDSKPKAKRAKAAEAGNASAPANQKREKAKQ